MSAEDFAKAMLYYRMISIEDGTAEKAEAVIDDGYSFDSYLSSTGWWVIVCFEENGVKTVLHKFSNDIGTIAWKEAIEYAVAHRNSWVADPSLDDLLGGQDE